MRVGKVYDKIVWVDTHSIIPYWRNPRINDKTVDALVHAIKEVGFNVPIVIDKDNVIIKGHARHKAAVRLGMKVVPCIISENTDEMNRLDRIADNKIEDYSQFISEILTDEVEKFPEKYQSLYDSIMFNDYSAIDSVDMDSQEESYAGDVIAENIDLSLAQEVDVDVVPISSSQSVVDEPEVPVKKFITFVCPYCKAINRVELE